MLPSRCKTMLNVLFVAWDVLVPKFAGEGQMADKPCEVESGDCELKTRKQLRNEAAPSQAGPLGRVWAGQFSPGVRVPTRSHKPKAAHGLSAPKSRHFAAQSVKSVEGRFGTIPRSQFGIDAKY